MTNTTPGRETIQIVELIQPLCANAFGTAPCTATGTNDTKCYNTRATCQDVPNYRVTPEGGMTADRTYDVLDTMSQTDFTLTADFTIAVDVTLAADADGIIAELGGATSALFLGYTSGNLIFRAGDGATGHPSNTAKVSVTAASVGATRVTLVGQVDVSANKVTLGMYDPATKEYTEIGTDTAVGSFTDWSGSANGAIGRIQGATAVGESTANYTENITEARVYDSALPAAFDEDSFTQSLYFSRGRVSEQIIDGVPNIIPSVLSVSTTPTKINMNTANPDAKGLGNRAVSTITFQDHLHTDFIVDPYLSGRSWDPLTAERGTYWTRWIVRNKYHLGMRIKIYEGYVGEALSAMRTREYFTTEITGPNSSGVVTIRGKDALARIEERKAMCPVASPGVMRTALNTTDTFFDIAGAVLSEYPSSGILRIDDEIVTYTAISEVADYLHVTGVDRAQYNTTVDEHDLDATVQECVLFSEQSIDTALETLLVDYGGIEYNWLDRAAWETEATTYLGFYNVRALITEPTAVEKLVGELQTQCLFYLWWCECNSLIKMAAVSGLRSTIPTVTEATGIVAGTYDRKEHDRQRLSRVWMHYDQKNYAESAESFKAYNTSYVIANLDEESAELYGTPAIKTIYSRWLRSEVLVRNTVRKILVRQVDPPETITFQLDAKDRDIWTGSKVYLSHFSDVDQYGARRLRIWTIISAEEIVPGETIKYEAENTTAYGISNFIMATGAADYPGAGSTPDKNCYIGDNDGLLSDSADAGTIT